MKDLLTFDLWQKRRTKGIKGRREEDEVHRSSNASQEYLVSGWLRVTEAQVSDGAASLRPRAQRQNAETFLFFEKLMREILLAYDSYCYIETFSDTDRTSSRLQFQHYRPGSLK